MTRLICFLKHSKIWGVYLPSNPITPMSILAIVLEEVADSKGVEPEHLPSILDAIDPDGMEDVINSFPATGGSLQFTYAGCAVRVSGNGYVAVDCSSQRSLSMEQSASNKEPLYR